MQMDAEFRCERCGRLAPTEMLACPERWDGACPYAVLRDRVSTIPLFGLFVLLFGSFFVCVPLGSLAAALRAGSRPGSLIGAIGMLVLLGGVASVGLVIALVGLYIALGRRTTLYNAQTGATWQRYTVAGLPIAMQQILGLEPVELGIDLPEGLDTPASHAFLPSTSLPSGRLSNANTWDDSAGELFHAAVVSLWARQVIALRRMNGRWWVLGRPVKTKAERRYLFVPGPAAGWLPIAGELERRIAEVVERWPELPEARECPPGAPIYNLARAVYEKDRTTPGLWLIQMVQEDASKAGVWRRAQPESPGSSGWLAKLARLIPRYEPEPAHADRLAEAQRQMRGVLERLAQTQPDIDSALKAEFRRGLRSRVESSG